MLSGGHTQGNKAVKSMQQRQQGVQRKLDDILRRCHSGDLSPQVIVLTGGLLSAPVLVS